MTDVIDLDGQTVSARALNWDGSQSDGTDWSLIHDDLPLLVNQVGTLTVNWVDDLGYTQFVVNGIPVDPASIEPVDYTGHALVASGWEGVPRDADGKWTTGPGGIGTWAPTPPPQTPGQESMWTPGQVAAQKAAATKKAKAAAANAAAEAQKIENRKIKAALEAEMAEVAAKNAEIAAYKQSPKGHADDGVRAVIHSIENGNADYPDPADLMMASPEMVTAYLQVSLGDTYAKKTFQGTLDPASAAAMAATVAGQHMADAMMLEGIGYLGGRPATAVEARRAVLRETGERKPTGGPGQGQAIHTFYGEEVIRALPMEKQAAILVHHTGGSYTTEQAMSLGYPLLADKAVAVDKAYKAAVDELVGNGADPSTIPHSNSGAQFMTYGSTKGLPPAAAAKVSKPVASSATSLGKPANWASMSPGKKAAWTKKYGAGKTAEQAAVAAMHPGNWEDMSPGKKAAWTKKHNAGGTSTKYPNGPSDPPGPPIHSKDGAVTFTPTVPLGSHDTVTKGDAHLTKSAALTYIEGLKNESVEDPYNAHIQASYKMSSSQKAAWSSYYSSGYIAMNQCAKYGKGCTPSVKGKISALQSAIAVAGTPSPKHLWRGKSAGKLKDLDFKVGETFQEDSFGSWATSKDFAHSWGSFGWSEKSVVYHLVESHGAKSVPSGSGEHERIMPRGTRYRVVGIHDFIDGTVHNRMLDVELVYAPVG